MSPPSSVDLGRVTVIITGSLHERSRDCPVNCLSSVSFVRTLLAKIYSISQIVYIYPGRVESVWEGVFKIL